MIYSLRRTNIFYGVLQKTLKTDFGKNLVRTYHGKMDGRAVYMDLLTHMRTYSAARIASQKLLNFITNFHIHTIKGKYTYRSTVLYWTNKVQEYNEIMGNNGFSTDQARSFFINTLSTVRKLASIHTQELNCIKSNKES